AQVKMRGRLARPRYACVTPVTRASGLAGRRAVREPAPGEHVEGGLRLGGDRAPLPGEERLERPRGDSGSGLLPLEADPLQGRLVARVEPAIETPRESKLEDQIGADGVVVVRVVGSREGRCVRRVVPEAHR